MPRIPLVLAVVVLAGCGGSTKSAPPITVVLKESPAHALPGSHVLYRGGDWGVVVLRNKAAAAHLVGNVWHLDRSGRVTVTILGPQPGHTTSNFPQIAAEVSAKSQLIESGLWVDGQELAVKGGGTPTKGTIYGAPGANLEPGMHLAVAYGRTATTGTAVAWSFRSR